MAANINLAGFNREWTRAIKKLTGIPPKVAKAATKELLSNIIQTTPVDTGHLKGNWQTTLGAPASGEIDRLDKGGGAAISEMIGVVNNWDLKIHLSFTNTAPYSELIEYGYSRIKAPAGMVRINLVTWQSIIYKMSRRYKDS